MSQHSGSGHSQQSFQSTDVSAGKKRVLSCLQKRNQSFSILASNQQPTNVYVDNRHFSITNVTKNYYLQTSEQPTQCLMSMMYLL